MRSSLTSSADDVGQHLRNNLLVGDVSTIMVILYLGNDRVNKRLPGIFNSIQLTKKVTILWFWFHY